MEIKIKQQEKCMAGHMVPGDIFIHKGDIWLTIKKNIYEHYVIRCVNLKTFDIDIFIEKTTYVQYIGKMEIIDNV